MFVFMLYVACKRGLLRKFARFVLFRSIKKRSFNLLCVLDHKTAVFCRKWCASVVLFLTPYPHPHAQGFVEQNQFFVVVVIAN